MHPGNCYQVPARVKPVEPISRIFREVECDSEESRGEANNTRFFGGSNCVADCLDYITNTVQNRSMQIVDEVIILRIETMKS